jgi:hypothetical protein
MSSRDRKRATNHVVARVAVAGVLAVGAAVASAAIAAADPAPDVPVDPAAVPAPPPPPPEGPTVPLLGTMGPQGLNVLAQNGAPPVGVLGVPDLGVGDLTNLIGQNPVPTAPGGPPGAPPNLRAFNNAYVLPQNEVPSAPGKGTQVGVTPGDENADISGRQYVGKLRDLYRNGNLKGSLLGQMPQQQLGESLPGTAPPPGTNIPPGLVQYLPEPPDPAVGPPAPLPPAPPAG